MRKQKRGFTLIELLAVIVILAVIAIIVTPTVTGIIKQAKDSADKSSVEGYVKAAENYYAEATLDSKKASTLGTDVFDKLEVSGGKATSGSVIIDETGNISISVVINNKCYRKADKQSIKDLSVSDNANDCFLLVTAPEECFSFNSSTGTIQRYLQYLNNVNTQGTCPANFVIPSTIGGVEVKKIGDTSFSGASYINYIELPSTIQKIEDRAFIASNLSGIDLNDGLQEIGTSAFQQSMLKSIKIPDSVTTLSGNSNFQSITTLEYADLGNGVTSIPTYAFMYDSNLKSVKIGHNVQSIGERAFQFAGVESIVIPGNVENIGGYSFFQSRLSSLLIEDGVKNIGCEAFMFTLIDKIDIPASVLKIDAGAFEQESNLTMVTFHEGLQEIGNSAFAFNSITGSINLPNSLTILGVSAFYTNKITSLELGSNLTSIDSFAFMGNNIGKVVIPNSITTIGSSAFARNSIKELNIPSSVTSIADNAFALNNLIEINIPSSVTSLGGGAFTGNNLPIDKAIIYSRNSDGTEDKTIISSYARKDAGDVTIPSGVKTVKSFSFEQIGLTGIVIPASVVTIESYSFSYNQISSITLNSGLTSIANYAFKSNNISNLTVPSTVTSIEDYAFSDNVISTLTLNNGITFIGQYAFQNNKLTSVTIPSTTTLVDKYAFKGNQIVTLNCSAKAIGDYAFSENAISSLTLNSGVTSIGTWAFAKNQLVSVTIPSTVTTIGGGAFMRKNTSTETSNPSLTKIVNKTGRSFDWWNIITWSYTGGTFTTGSINSAFGTSNEGKTGYTVTISAS